MLRAQAPSKRRPKPVAMRLNALPVRAALAAGTYGITRTPVVRSESLSERLGGNVFLKLENLQITGSFKARGALNALLARGRDDLGAGVVTMSAGNHAQAVAYFARRLGVPATIVMPELTAAVKVRRTRELGARVVLYGENIADSAERAAELAAGENLRLIHPYDDIDVIGGQSTATLELLEDAGELDVLLVPVGGGGLLAGAVLAATERDVHPEIIGVQSEFYPSYYAAVNGVEVTPGGATIADGIAVKVPGKLPLSITMPVVREVLLVDEIAIEMAVEHLIERERLVVEGAGAVGIAALLAHEDRFRGQRVGIIVSGGNIDPGLLASLIVRSRMRNGSIARIRVHILDRPGQLGAIAMAVAGVGGNVLDVQHHRLMGDVPARYAELDLTIELDSGTQAATVVEALRERGFSSVILSGGSHGEP